MILEDNLKGIIYSIIVWTKMIHPLIITPGQLVNSLEQNFEIL